MTGRAVSLHFEQNGRCYLPWLSCNWIDEDEWYVSLTVGNRYCDPLAGATVTFKGAWLKRLGNWWFDRRKK